MKKLFSLFAILMINISVMAAIDPVQPTVGDGSTDNPYKIGTPGNLVWFANQVNGGQTSVCGELTGNVDLGDDQTMIGTETNKYSGTFDGQHHTVTVNYKSSEPYTALFRYTSKAVIQNLNTAGTIETSSQYAGGIAAYTYALGSNFPLKKDHNPFINCRSSVTIKSTFEGAGYHGGLVADYHGAAFYNCAFMGSMLGEKTTHCGGFVGRSSTPPLINCCLFAPKEITVSTEGSCTMYVYTANSSTNTGTYFSNNYYTRALGTEQGTKTTEENLKSGRTCSSLNRLQSDGKQAWYQTLGTDNFPVLAPSHGTVYSGTLACSSTSEYSNQTHTCSGNYDADGIDKCSRCEGFNSQPAQRGVNDTILIKNKGNFIWYANYATTNFAYAFNGNTKGHAKLCADIDLGDTQVMIGTEDVTASFGCLTVFLGQGHNINVNYTSTSDYTALFRNVSALYIRNLNVSGVINTSHKYAGGIAGKVVDYTFIYDCTSSVTINSSVDGDGCHGGLIGGIVRNGYYSLTSSNVMRCAFTGKILGPNTTKCSGFVGESYISNNFTNSFFRPSEVTAQGAYTLGYPASITNCYYETAFGEAQATQATAEQFRNGEVCYNLNNKGYDNTVYWYQTLGTDDIPTHDSSHDVVNRYAHNMFGEYYYGAEDHDLVCSNYDEDDIGTCEVCSTRVYKEPDVVDGVYEIKTEKDLKIFAGMVGAGRTSINAKLLNNITLDSETTMIGTSDKAYSGTFDGNGKTITVAYNTNEQYTALFRYADGATITGLTTAGTITTSKKYAAGIIARSKNCTISGCISKVDISSTVSGEGSHGGLVAYVDANSELTNCIFAGSLTGTKTTGCGGLVGFCNQSLTLTNCLFAPSSVTVSSTDAKTLARAQNPTITNCGYHTQMGTAQGKALATDALTTGEATAFLNGYVVDGSQSWYQNINNGNDIDAMPVLDNTHGTVYSGEMACPSIRAYSNYTHQEDATPSKDGYLTCIRANQDCAKIYGYQEPQKDSEEYLISNRGNLIWFANAVNSGTGKAYDARLTADINLSNEQVMIGSSTKEFTGTFDGDGHTLTVNYEAKEDYTAPFRYVNGATITNIIVAGSITSNYQFAAGIVAYSEGTTNITKCQSSVEITNKFTEAKDANYGGIVADNQDKVYLTNVLFDGKLLGSNATNCGGLVGWSEVGANITNCLFYPLEIDFSDDSASTLARGNGVVVNNSYYTIPLGTAQGNETYVLDALSGKLCTQLNNNVTDDTQGWYQNLSSGSVTADAYPVPFNTHGTVYAGDDAHPNTLDYSNETHVFVNNNGFLTDEVCDLHKLESPEHDDEDEAYLLKNGGNLVWFSEHVSKNDGNINAVMENDIDMNGVDFTPIGAYPSDENKPYNGTFNGQGHRIKNLVVNKTNDLVGLFGCVSGNTTIKNLIIDKSCSFTRTSGYGAAGIVGCLARTSEESDDAISLTLDACGNEANVTGDINAAGLVGGVYNTETHGNATVNITNCYNTGNIKGSGASNGESAAFIAYGNSNTTVKNCYNTGTVVGNWAGLSLVRVKNGSDVTLRNIYNLEGVAAQNSDDCKTVTADQVRLGDLCNKLRSGENATIWAQDLETDAQPIFGTEGLHYSRKMANEWGTLVLPFEIHYNPKNTNNYKLYSLSIPYKTVLVFNDFGEGYIPAGKPVAVRAIGERGSDGKYTIDITPSENTTFSTTIKPVDEITDWTMNGTFTNLTDQTGIYYIADNQFWWAEEPITIAPFRAWFTGPKPASGSAKVFSIGILEDGEADGILELKDGNLELRDGKFLENGKVVIFRNGKKYNLNGQEIQ